MFKSSFSGRKNSALAKADGRGTDVTGETRRDPRPRDTGRAGDARPPWQRIPAGRAVPEPRSRNFLGWAGCQHRLLPAQRPPAGLLPEPLGQVEEN